MKKTNVMRILDSAKIPYEAKEYVYNDDDLNGCHVAEYLGVAPRTVYKTLVARSDKGVLCVFCVAVDKELDLKKAAAASGNKRVELIHVKELQTLTGYVRGGCSPVGMKKQLATVFDSAVHKEDSISISAGQKGIQVVVNAAKLLAFLHADTADITPGEV